jgi:hypothetical protein
VEILVDCTWVGRGGGVASSRCGGGGAALSRTEGSAGGVPSKAHLRDSYFDRINDSILLFILSVKIVNNQ